MAVWPVQNSWELALPLLVLRTEMLDGGTAWIEEGFGLVVEQ